MSSLVNWAPSSIDAMSCNEKCGYDEPWVGIRFGGPRRHRCSQFQANLRSLGARGGGGHLAAQYQAGLRSFRFLTYPMQTKLTKNESKLFTHTNSITLQTDIDLFIWREIKYPEIGRIPYVLPTESGNKVTSYYSNPGFLNNVRYRTNVLQVKCFRTTFPNSVAMAIKNHCTFWKPWYLLASENHCSVAKPWWTMVHDLRQNLPF